MEKEQYLYVDMEDDEIWRLNITKLEEGEGNEFECVWKFDPYGEFPRCLRCMPVSSNLYMVGGQRDTMTLIPAASDYDYDRREYTCVPNLDVFAVDLNAKHGPTLSDFPRTRGPKTDPMVVFLNEKIYVLATPPPGQYLYQSLAPPVFEVYEPVNGGGELSGKKGSWKVLDSPPLDRVVIGHHYVWGHKIVIVTTARSYIFDTWTEKWECPGLNDSPPPFPTHRWGIEFQGFLIALRNAPQRLVAYQLDSDGIPNMRSYRVLDELLIAFSPPFLWDCFEGWVIHLGGDKFCLLYAGLDSWYEMWSARVAIFRLSVQCSAGGKSFPFACLEAVQHYYLRKIAAGPKKIFSAFVMCHDLDNHDHEADSSSMDTNLSGLDRSSVPLL